MQKHRNKEIENGGNKMPKKIEILETTVRDISDYPGSPSVDVEIGKGQGTKGKWKMGWSYLVGGIVVVYDDGQIISARTAGLMENMMKFRKQPKAKRRQ